MRALRRLQREQAPTSPFVFTSERAGPFTTAGFARMMERAGVEAGMRFKVHPHMLRHACGFALANNGHDTLNAGYLCLEVKCLGCDTHHSRSILYAGERRRRSTNWNATCAIARAKTGNEQ
jgi:Phage integrase family